MRQPFLPLLLFLCFLVGNNPSSVTAQMTKGSSPVPPPGLTLDRAITQALAHNRDLNVVRTEREISRGKVQQARRYPFNPEVILEGEFGRGTARDNGGVQRDLGGGLVGVSQVVELRGQRSLRTQIAEAEMNRTEWVVRDTEREVISATMKAFSDLLIAQERVALNREVVNLVTKLKDIAEDLARAGAVPELDILRADVERRRALNRLTLEEVSASTASRSLGLLIGEGPGSPLRITGLLLFKPIKEKAEELKFSAKANRPDLKASEAGLESAAASLRLIRSERYVPTMALSASYGRVAEFDSTNQKAILGISIPLPLLNRREGDVTAAEARVRREEERRERLIALIEKEVSTVLDRYAAAQRVVREFSGSIVPAQEENVRLIEGGYRLGEFRLTDALLAQRDLFETRSAYLDAISTYNAAVAEIYRTTGMRP